MKGEGKKEANLLFLFLKPLLCLPLRRKRREKRGYSLASLSTQYCSRSAKREKRKEGAPNCVLYWVPRIVGDAIHPSKGKGKKKSSSYSSPAVRGHIGRGREGERIDQFLIYFLSIDCYASKGSRREEGGRRKKKIPAYHFNSLHRLEATAGNFREGKKGENHNQPSNSPLLNPSNTRMRLKGARREKGGGKTGLRFVL